MPVGPGMRAKSCASGDKKVIGNVRTTFVAPSEVFGKQSENLTLSDLHNNKKL